MGFDGLLKSVYIVPGMIQLAKGVAAGAQYHRSNKIVKKFTLDFGDLMAPI